jgi:hypothetical protein
MKPASFDQATVQALVARGDVVPAGACEPAEHAATRLARAVCMTLRRADPAARLADAAAVMFHCLHGAPAPRA